MSLFRKRHATEVLMPGYGLSSDWVDAELKLHYGDQPLDVPSKAIQVMSRMDGDEITVSIDRVVEWDNVPTVADRAMIYLEGVPIAWITVTGEARPGDSVVITP